MKASIKQFQIPTTKPGIFSKALIGCIDGRVIRLVLPD
jgi:hypothetical protein